MTTSSIQLLSWLFQTLIFNFWQMNASIYLHDHEPRRSTGLVRWTSSKRPGVPCSPAGHGWNGHSWRHRTRRRPFVSPAPPFCASLILITFRWKKKFKITLTELCRRKSKQFSIQLGKTVSPLWNKMQLPPHRERIASNCLIKIHRSSTNEFTRAQALVILSSPSREFANSGTKMSAEFYFHDFFRWIRSVLGPGTFGKLFVTNQKMSIEQSLEWLQNASTGNHISLEFPPIFERRKSLMRLYLSVAILELKQLPLHLDFLQHFRCRPEKDPRNKKFVNHTTSRIWVR